MIRHILQTLSFLPLLLLAGSDALDLERPPVANAPIMISATKVINARVVTVPGITFLSAWTLDSPDTDFGGISALMHDGRGFTAFSDAGAIIRFTMNVKGAIANARTAPLPIGCAPANTRSALDVESVTRSPITGEILIGFERRQAICRAPPDLIHATTTASPAAMAPWPSGTGPEAMVTLSDGRTLVFAESGTIGEAPGPALIFSGTPTNPNAKPASFRYIPPTGYLPTDAAQLSDGRIVIVNRRYQFPISFSALITVVDVKKVKAGAVIIGDVIATMATPEIADNFEAIAVSQAGTKEYLWLMSDDNFIDYQRTYLLLFEIAP